MTRSRVGQSDITTKGGSRRLEKSHKVWMMMMIAASLMWAGAAEKPEQSKMTFKNHQNDLKQLKSRLKSGGSLFHVVLSIG